MVGYNSDLGKNSKLSTFFDPKRSDLGRLEMTVFDL